MATDNPIHYTTPGLDQKSAVRIIELLQSRLHACNDLHLTLKHVHWNVTGPHFIAVHEMIDPQVDAVRGMADGLAERIATLGGSPTGTPGAIVAERDWHEYSLGRASTQEHLGALDLVYRGVVSSYRDAIKELDDLDLVTQDLLIGQTEKLELFHWFVRAHLEDQGGHLATEDATNEVEAAVAGSETGVTRVVVTPPSRFGAAWRRRLSDGAEVGLDHLDARPGDALLVVIAHPDDEVLAMGATLAELGAASVGVHVLCLTGGEAALRHLGHEVPGLAETRRAELRRAGRLLGVRSVRALGFRDGELGEQIDSAAETASRIVESEQVAHVLTLWSNDPHPDHAAASQVAQLSARPHGIPVHQMPLWAFHWTDPAEVAAEVCVLRTSAWARRRRRAALASYVSQLRPLDARWTAILPDDVVGWEQECVVLT